MIFQPTNIYPSSLGGLGDGVIDATEDLTVSWQVNGNSPMTAYTITIYKNDTASTQVYTTGMVTLDTPFYGVDYNGNVQMFTATIAASELVDKVTNGNDYKMIIRQYWSTTDYVEQTSASAFSAKAKPTLSIDTITSPVTSRTTSIKATYSQAQGDTITWIRWRFASKDGAVYSILDDTHNIYGTAQLQYDYDGLFSGSTYAVKCEVQTSSGVDVTTDWYDFTVSYESEPMTGALVATCDKTNNGIKVEFPEIVNIPADDNFINKVGELTGEIVTTAKMPSSKDWASVTYGNGKFVAIASGVNGCAYSTDGITWTQSTMPSPIYWRSVTYGNGKFVAVAYHSSICAYSTDGINWTSSTMSSSQSWYSVTYGNGKFVAIASNSNVCAYSTDGITWTSSTMPSSEYWYSVTYGNGKFVAIASNSNVCAYSTDGITWTSSTMPSSKYWRPIAYGNGKFVAIGYSSNVCAYSTDGITWTLSTMPSSQNWQSVTYGNGKFVAVVLGTNVCAYSTDGITWTSSTMPSSEYWYSVTYGNGKFVAVVYNSDICAYSTDAITWKTKETVLSSWSGVASNDDEPISISISENGTVNYSNDGITWTDSSTKLTTPTGTSHWSSAYGNGTFVALPYHTTTDSYSYAYSTDNGSTWTNSTIDNFIAYDVIYADNKFVAVGQQVENGTRGLAESTDGITWTLHDMPSDNVWGSVVWDGSKLLAAARDINADNVVDLTTDVGLSWKYGSMTAKASWCSVTYGNGKFVAIASNSNVCAYSTDGITWNTSTMPGSRLWRSVTYGNGKFVAIASDSNVCAYSTDGITWASLTMPSSTSWQSVAYGNGRFVAIVYNSSTCAYSTDGITWTSSTMPSSEYWYSVTYGNGKFVAIAYNSNVCAYSTDGITWTSSTMPSSKYWQSVAYGNGKFVAIASSSNVCAYSTDGITWTSSTMPSSKYWCSVTYGNGKFVAIASNSNVCAYSTDGITWASLTMPSSTSWNSVTYGNGKFVAIIAGALACAYANTCNSYTLPLYTSKLAYGNNTYVAVQTTKSADYDAGTVMYSTDLSNWTSVGSVTNGKTAVGIEYIHGYFVVASTDGRYAYSKDGITWKYQTLHDSSIVVSDIGGFNGDVLFLPSQSNTTTEIWLSDGTTIDDSYAVLQNGAELIYDTVGDEAMSFEGDNAVVWRGKCNVSYDIFSITYNTDGDKYKFARVDNKIVVTDTASGNTVSISITTDAYYMTIMYNKPYLYVSTMDSNESNLQTYQLSVSDFIDLSLITSMSVYKTLSVGSCDLLYVSNGTLDEDTINELLSDYTYHPSDLPRHFLADYNSGLGGGASESGEIESIALYRLENKDEAMLHIYDAQVGESSIIDFVPTSDNEYQYYGVAVIGGKYSSSTISSNSVTPHFGNWCLYSCTLDNDGIYHPESVFLFKGNLTSGEVSNNSQPNVLNNFTRYPLIQQSPWNYKSGKLQGLIGVIVDGVYSDTISLRDAIYDLSTTDNTLFLKNRKGDLMMVKLSDAIGMTTDDVSAGQYQTMSLPWVEVGSTDEVSIILN